ncbi:MAG: hypothetical protein IJW29_01070 [Clostridia bacterium]|nr:hypothetical protein [Clostridia bacterium]
MACNKNRLNGIGRDFLEATLTAADAVTTALVGTKQLAKAACEIGKKAPEALKLNKLSGMVSAHLCAGVLLDGDFIPTLAQAIDRTWMKLADAKRAKCTCAEAEEETVECACEEAVEEVAPAVEEAIPVVAEVTEESDDEREEEENESFAGLSVSGLDFIDAKEEPDAYAALLAREAAGEIQIVTRYRRSYLSRLIQSQGDVQAYYSVIKNKLMSYKGVKGRISWGNESFNKGRTYIAKVNAKAKTLYLYLALDPVAVEAIEDGKYNVTDMSAKKKYENVPTLIKVKGPRKLKHALELIDMLCGDNLQLPPVKNFEETDYTVPYQTTEELVEAGSIKMMVAGVEVTNTPNEATDGDVTAV